MDTKQCFKDLPDFVDHIQSQGRYCFSKAAAEVATSSNGGAFRKALWRLEDKKRIRMARRGFYLIVPFEYSQSGIILTWPPQADPKTNREILGDC